MCTFCLFLFQFPYRQTYSLLTEHIFTEHIFRKMIKRRETISNKRLKITRIVQLAE